MYLLVTGPPAAGKSTFCRSCLHHFLDFDDYAQARFRAGKVGPPRFFHGGDEWGREAEWDDYVGFIHDHGYRILVDCVPTAESRVRYLEAFHPLSILWLYADLPTLLRRNRERGAQRIPDHLLLEKVLSQELPTPQEGFMAIYLKKMQDGTVAALGDMETLKAYGGSFDAVISDAQWRASDCTARIAEDGAIVLGLTEEEKTDGDAVVIRAERDRRLRACDKMSPMRWEAMGIEDRDKWAAYRQTLLDIPQTDGFPWNGDVDKAPWPTKPE